MKRERSFGSADREIAPGFTSQLIYFTINQNKNTDEILKNSFYICYLIHHFFLTNFGK